MIPEPMGKAAGLIADSATTRSAIYRPTWTQRWFVIPILAHSGFSVTLSVGAVCIQALAVDKRLVCGVAQSPFASLRGVIHDYFREKFLLPFDFIPDAALRRSAQIAHFHVDSVCPLDDARRVFQPTMIVQGEADTKISPENGRRVYRSLASPSKQLYVVHGAGHDDIAGVGGSDYQQRIIAFFRQHLAAPG
jgi:pimeloyl-ACP methyl ester carboxylesterase